MEFEHERDTQEYGSYLVGEGVELEELDQQYDQLERAVRGYNIFTVYERDLSSFRTLKELQAWCDDAFDLSRVKPNVALLREAQHEELLRALSDAGKAARLTTFHFEVIAEDKIHMHALEKTVPAPGDSVATWFRTTEMSEAHGWEEPKMRLDFNGQPDEALSETYLCTALMYVDGWLDDYTSESAAPIGEHDLVVIGFDASNQVLALPRTDTMLNVQIVKDGFTAVLTGHYAPPRKRFLNEFRQHRRDWAPWYANDPALTQAELERGVTAIENTVTHMLQQEREAN